MFHPVGSNSGLIGAVAVFIIWVVSQVLGFLQPVLVPVAVAAIIAFLIEPLIDKLTRRGMNRTRAMLIVFIGFHVLVGGTFVVRNEQLVDGVFVGKPVRAQTRP